MGLSVTAVMHSGLKGVLFKSSPLCERPDETFLLTPNDQNCIRGRVSQTFQLTHSKKKKAFLTLNESRADAGDVIWNQSSHIPQSAGFKCQSRGFPLIMASHD